MWQPLRVLVSLSFLIVLSKSKPSAGRDVVHKIISRLDNNLDYILENYEAINIDCLFGVVLAEAILQDIPPRFDLEKLKNKTREIYLKASPLMDDQPNWYFTKHIVVPNLWPKRFRFKLNEFSTAYASRTKADALFDPKTYENWTEGFSDFCISSVVNDTIGEDLKPKTCRLDKKCEGQLEDLDDGSGYMLTHKLLLLQIARARKCKMNPKVLSASIKKVCSAIYGEVMSVEFFSSLDEIFDLFLEQCILCGYEGYADFLHANWLDYILKVQHDSGCFPSTVGYGRRKRETNEWKDGCADHTTGLGAAILSLYLNYFVGVSML